MVQSANQYSCIMPDYFPNVSKIEFEGPDSDNPLAFHHYNPDELVAGKSMKGPSALWRGLLALHAQRAG